MWRMPYILVELPFWYDLHSYIKSFIQNFIIFKSLLDYCKRDVDQTEQNSHSAGKALSSPDRMLVCCWLCEFVFCFPEEKGRMLSEPTFVTAGSAGVISGERDVLL